MAEEARNVTHATVGSLFVLGLAKAIACCHRPE